MTRATTTKSATQSPTSNTAHELSVGVIGSIIAAVLVLIFSRFIITRVKNAFVTARSFRRLYASLASIRMEAFNRDRRDYETRTRHAQLRKTISDYVLSAEAEIVIVSATFATAVFHENIGDRLKGFVMNRRGRVLISLLDPNNSELVSSVSRTLSRSPEELRSEITSAMNILINVHSSLPADCKSLFQLRYHQTIPFGSAIILDPAAKHGSVQIETKPYKAGMDASIGFTLRAGGPHPLYATLVTAYRDLINDGRDAISVPMVLAAPYPVLPSDET